MNSSMNHQSLQSNKRGYFFIIDALMGSTIIFIALIIILSSGPPVNRVQYNYELAEEYSSYVINTRLEEMNNEYITQRISIGAYPNLKETLAQQIDRYVYAGDSATAEELFTNTVVPLIPAKYNIEYTIITDTGDRNQIYITPGADDASDAQVVITSRKITST